MHEVPHAPDTAATKEDMADLETSNGSGWSLQQHHRGAAPAHQTSVTSTVQPRFPCPADRISGNLKPAYKANSMQND